MSFDTLLILALTTPLIGGVFISRLRKVPNIREAATLITAGMLLFININIYQQFETFASTTVTLAVPFDGLAIRFSADAAGVMFALIASSLWIVTSIYAIGYMRGHHEKHQTRFFTLFAVALAGVMAIAYSDNLFTLFLFYEVLTVSTYPLVTHAGTSKARKGGRIYLALLMGSSIAFFLPAILITWHHAGHLDFTQGGILAGNFDPTYLLPLMLLFLFGIGKAGLMPVHKWLPSAMVAPTPVSALLHAVAVVKAGVFSIYKVVAFIVGPDFLTQSGASDVLLWIPMITILLGSLIAMTRDNFKERLAYSTISQLSYIILGVLLANSMGLLGGGLHIAMHAFAKITLFFAAGAVLVVTHKTKISELDGLGRQMPFTFVFFTIGTLSIIGLPPFGGMWSKWFLLTGSAEYGGASVTQWALLITLMISSLLNIVYLLSISVRAFFRPAPAGESYTEAPLTCIIGMAIPAMICIYLFFDPSVFYQLASSAATGVTS